MHRHNQFWGPIGTVLNYASFLIFSIPIVVILFTKYNINLEWVMYVSSFAFSYVYFLIVSSDLKRGIKIGLFLGSHQLWFPLLNNSAEKPWLETIALMCALAAFSACAFFLRKAAFEYSLHFKQIVNEKYFRFKLRRGFYNDFSKIK